MNGLGLLRSVVIALAALAACAGTAAAHPHSWITVETTVLYENGAFTGLQHKWSFDEFYTAMAVEGLDTNKDGKFDREELAELAKANIDGLKEFAYFTFPTLAGHELKFGEPRDYWLEHTDNLLSLHVTLPFAQPVLADAKGLAFSIQDPTFYIAFEFAKTDPVKFSPGAPKTCQIRIGGPDPKADSPLVRSGPAATVPGGFSMDFAKPVAIDCQGP